jgi:hypothetical protein
MTIISKRLPLNTASGDRSIRRNPYTLSITELQQYAEIFYNTAAFFNVKEVAITESNPIYTLTENNVIIIEATENGEIFIPGVNNSQVELKWIYIKNSVESTENIDVLSVDDSLIEGESSINLAPGDSVTLTKAFNKWHII